MRTLRRSLGDYRSLWRIWLPLVTVAAIAPLAALAVPLVEKRLIDSVILAHRVDLLIQIAVVYCALWVLSTVVLMIAGVLRAYLAERYALLLQRRLLLRTGELSPVFSRQEHSGRTTSLFVNDVPSVTDLFGTTITSGLSSLVAVGTGAVVMLSLNWQLGLAAIAGPALVALVSAGVTRPLRPAARRAQEKAAEMVERIQEHLTGMREVAAFGQAPKQDLCFLSSLRELLRLRMRVTMIDTGIQSGASVMSLVTTLSILVFGAYLVIEGRTTLGTVVAMRSLFGLVFQPAGQIIAMFGGIQKALGAADRLYAFLDRRPTVEECPQPRTLAHVRGQVTFDQVTFGYGDGCPVLHDVSLSVEPGEMIALVGPSGAGKSSLMNLLPRFYDPNEGRILLDGTDLRVLSLENLRSQIGFVFQDTFLFASTIRENITLGQEDADEIEIIAAARAANAWNFIKELPGGLDTRVGERGVRLSEGQKQRIAIARALLRDPRILILDEPTSALDAHSEHLLQGALATLMEGRTTFVIAHRLSTIQRADRILVLDHGYLVEQGSHPELLRHGGIYRQLHDLQFGGALQLDRSA